MNKYETLNSKYDRYEEVKKQKPYNPDIIQGAGMAFATEWNAMRGEICKDFAIEPTEFNYQMRDTIMRKIKNESGRIREAN